VFLIVAVYCVRFACCELFWLVLLVYSRFTVLVFACFGI